MWNTITLLKWALCHILGVGYFTALLSAKYVLSFFPTLLCIQTNSPLVSIVKLLESDWSVPVLPLQKNSLELLKDN